jgi:hypothetical protein
MSDIGRRSFLTGLVSAFAAPAIVRASSLMPVRGLVIPASVQTFDKLIVFRKEIIREYIRQNLFNPYIGGGLTSIIRAVQEDARY